MANKLKCTTIKKPGKKKKAKNSRSRAKTPEEISHLNLIGSLPCCICGSPTDIHHIREYGEPRDHFKTIPLCHYHHQGDEGIHHLGKDEWRNRYGHENTYLEKLNNAKNNHRD